MARFCARNFHPILSFNPHFKKPCKSDGTPPCKSQSQEGLQTAIELNAGHAPITATSLYSIQPSRSRVSPRSLCAHSCLSPGSVAYFLMFILYTLFPMFSVKCAPALTGGNGSWISSLVLLNWSLCLQPCSYSSPYLLSWGPTVPNCLESSLHSINICLPDMC